MAEVAGDRSSSADAAFAQAHQALRADPAVQFDLPAAQPPEPPPQWLIDFFRWLGEALEPVGRFFAWISSFMPQAPFARILLWGVIALAAAGLLWVGLKYLRAWYRGRRPKPVAAPEAADEALLGDLPMRQWLQEADRLAAEGRYGAAVHHLLVRSVEDIARRRPNLVRPSLTSRDLAKAEALPVRARGLFSGIAAVVERSLFGGQSVGADEWQRCRSAYSDFADRRTWTA